MANRAQRRQAERTAPSKIDMGEIMTRLEKPEMAGEMTVLEATEIKARNSEGTWLVEQITETQERLQHFQRLVSIANNEKIQQIRAMCMRHGLDPERNDYEFDTERGAIMLVGTLQKVAPQLVEARPVEEPNGAEASTEEPEG